LICAMSSGLNQLMPPANERCSRQALFCSALRAQLLDVLAAELRR
jgi:hypothetical protein